MPHFTLPHVTLPHSTESLCKAYPPELAIIPVQNALTFMYVIMISMAEEKELITIKSDETVDEAKTTNQGIKSWVIILIAIFILAIITTMVFFLTRAEVATTVKIRDILIIFMALEFIILGVALVVLILQLAKLANLLENEVKPILAATSETINTLKGTTEFLSENLVAPVIKLNGYMAGLKKVFDILKIVRK